MANIKSLSASLASGGFLIVVGGIIGSVITGFFTLKTHSTDIDAKMVEISIGILATEAKPEAMPLRNWAIEMINKKSDVHFNDSQRALLLKHGLPALSESMVLNSARGNKFWMPAPGESQFGPVPMPYNKAPESK
jgi:hypothetical protein